MTRTKTFRLGRAMLILGMAMAAVMVCAPVSQAQIPPTATVNAITIGIGRPNAIWHDGDTIEYTVTVAVPSILLNGDEIVAQVTDISTTMTRPDGVVVNLPDIPVLNPGDVAVFTSADAAGLAYVIDHADEIVAIDGHRIVVADADTDGTSQVDEDGEPASAHAETSSHVHHPNTEVTITASAPAVVVSGTVDLTVTESNTGDVNFDQVQVVVNDGTTDIATLVAPPDAGDTGDDGILASFLEGGPETWTWVIHNVPISAATTFTATGSGRERLDELTGDTITFPDYPDEQDAVDVEVLSTITTIGASAPAVVEGGSVDLTVTEENDGTADLTNVSVEVLKNGGAFATLVAPPDSGDTGDDGILGVGETWTWVIDSGPITDTDVFQATGSGDFDGVTVTYPDDQDERDSVTVLGLTTTLGIDASAPEVTSGDSVDLLIVEGNDGAGDLTNVSVEILKNGALLTTLVAPPDAGDDGDGVLEPGETWSWTISSGPITVNPTVFQATGSAEFNGIVVTYPDDPNERDTVTVTVVQQGDEGLTPGFWKNHTNCWVDYSPTDLVGDVFDIPAQFSSLADDTLLQALSYKGGKTTKAKAQILLRQAVAALLNASHPDVNYPISVATVIADTNAALASLDQSLILDLKNQFDTWNNYEGGIDAHCVPID